MSIFFLNILHAATLETKAQYKVGEEIIINFTDMIGQNKDWIAIYPTNTDNDWANVVKWSWTKDIINGQVTFKNIPIGSYEARAFYNNSYDIEAVTIFKVNGIGLGSIIPYYDNGKVDIKLKVSWEPMFNPNPKDWIGLYKKSTSNDWDNVIKWAWIKDFKDEHIGITTGSLGEVDLADGEYEVRYFLNNSFTTYKSKPVVFF